MGSRLRSGSTELKTPRWYAQPGKNSIRHATTTYLTNVPFPIGLLLAENTELRYGVIVLTPYLLVAKLFLLRCLLSFLLRTWTPPCEESPFLMPWLAYWCWRW